MLPISPRSHQQRSASSTEYSRGMVAAAETDYVQHGAQPETSVGRERVKARSTEHGAKSTES